MEFRIFDSVSFFWLNESEINSLPKDQTDLEIKKLKIRSIAASGISSHDAICVHNKKSHFVYQPFHETVNLDVEACDLLLEYGYVCTLVFFTNLALIPFRMLNKLANPFVNHGLDFIHDLRTKNAKLAVLSFLSFVIDGFIGSVKTFYYGLGIGVAALDGMLLNPIRGFHAIELLERKYEPFPLNQGFSNIDERLKHLGLIDGKINPKDPEHPDELRFEILEGEIAIKEKADGDIFPTANYLEYQARIYGAFIKTQAELTLQKIQTFIQERWNKAEEASA
jgi:hypothetical protein